MKVVSFNDIMTYPSNGLPAPPPIASSAMFSWNAVTLGHRHWNHLFWIDTSEELTQKNDEQTFSTPWNCLNLESDLHHSIIYFYCFIWGRGTVSYMQVDCFSKVRTCLQHRFESLRVGARSNRRNPTRALFLKCVETFPLPVFSSSSFSAWSKRTERIDKIRRSTTYCNYTWT